jgi:DNA-binding transcriptional regulator YhcF (GntR family)
VPEAQRSRPLWRQVADYYKGQILSGELRQGDMLPSIRDMAREWQVSPATAQQALAHLHLAERLVDTDPSGARVGAPRASLSPQQRMRLAAPPASELVTVTFAGPVSAPEYIVPMLGLQDGPPDHPVIRREEVTRLAGGSPSRLSVTWVHPRYFSRVPELVVREPLPDPKGAAHFIAEQSGWDPASLTGGIAFECRLAKDDGRELPALDLEPGAYVLAGVNGWRHGDDLLEYTEFVLPPNRVIEADIDPA